MTQDTLPDKIAVDTSIWLRGLLFGGSAEELIKMAVTGRVRLLTTEAQFRDLAIVMRDRLGFSDNAVVELRKFMDSCAEFVETPAEPAAGPANGLSPLLSAARHQNVSAIATTERSPLVRMSEFEGIPILALG